METENVEDVQWTERILRLRFPFGGTLKTLKEPGRNRPEDEAADMSRISDTPRLYVCHGADLTENLNEKPESNQQPGGNERYADEYAKKSSVRIRSRGYVIRKAPITPAIAPLAPRLGTVELGMATICANEAATPLRR